ncbi:MAG: flagellar biosynthesis anti-sigma factor FlgM [Candidatus Omnitrophica bacterium]|nr:flagellar biosynthesis anti-sigma factor FlgM [Candidatus Omnitrophota bacterium]MCM8824118.1 flagellar biosynthesis anti-sigma factor FlgM [Candidatus Omnitrophota bacterium]MCM8827077.1 flagellar biosynthesis anti-sigma factor FlgM [Candidatus Omnitrophota bacterium]
MDIFRLEYILNALRFDKRVELPQKQSKSEEIERSVSSSSEGDSVVISEEAFLKSTIEEVAGQIIEESSEEREDRISQIKEKIANQEYRVSSENLASKIINGPQIYEQLK